MVGHFHGSHLSQVCIEQAFLTHSCITHTHALTQHACTHPAGKCCHLLLLSHVNHDGVDCLEGLATLSSPPSSFTGLLQFLLHEHNCLGPLTSTSHGCALVLILVLNSESLKKQIILKFEQDTSISLFQNFVAFTLSLS